jgi:hypothetical protein
MEEHTEHTINEGTTNSSDQTFNKDAQRALEASPEFTPGSDPLGLAKSNSAFSQMIAQFEQLKELANYFAQSEAFAKEFEMKDADGKPILNEDGTPKRNVADIVIALMAGRELGLDVTGSLLLGKKLNSKTYMAVYRGRGIGIDAATSMEKIYSIPTKNGTVSYTGVDIISARLIKGGVEFMPFIRDYAPLYQYYVVGENNAKTAIPLSAVEDPEGNVYSKYFIVSADKTKKEVEDARLSSKILLIAQEIGKITTIRFKRKINGKEQVLVVSYDTQKAKTAGLLPIYDDKGNLLQAGKDNWIAHEPTMLRNRTISIGGRIIGADLINGLYTEDEVSDLTSD